MMAIDPGMVPQTEVCLFSWLCDHIDVKHGCDAPADRGLAQAQRRPESDAATWDSAAVRPVLRNRQTVSLATDVIGSSPIKKSSPAASALNIELHQFFAVLLRK